jgi:hypothetical protein
MANDLSEECKNRIKVLEDEILWALKDEYKHIIFSDIITFLALSCRYEQIKMDDPCKETMAGYEKDILALSIRTEPDKISGLETLLTKIRRDISK